MRRHFDIDKHLFYLLTREIIAMRETANNQVSEEKCLDSTGNETLQNNGELAHQQNRGRRNRYPKAVEDEIWDWASRPCYELDRERNGVPCRDLKKAASEWALLSHSRDSPKTSYVRFCLNFRRSVLWSSLHSDILSAVWETLWRNCLHIS